MAATWTHLDKTPRGQVLAQMQSGLTGTHISANFFREYRSVLEAMERGSIRLDKSKRQSHRAPTWTAARGADVAIVTTSRPDSTTGRGAKGHWTRGPGQKFSMPLGRKTHYGQL